jgi:hypothetical protein
VKFSFSGLDDSMLTEINIFKMNIFKNLYVGTPYKKSNERANPKRNDYHCT